MGAEPVGGAPVDVTGWRRREHFAHFRAMPDPWFNVCVEVEVSRLREATAGGGSFFLAALFLLMRAVNATEAFRMRLRGEGAWLHDRVHASSTILLPDETFVFARFPGAERYPPFHAAGTAQIERLRRGGPGLGGAPAGDDLVYHSSLPWIRFTAFSNPRPLAGDSIPRLVFGRCFEQAGVWRMPLAVEVHHALVDGLDVARLIDRFQQSLDAPDLA